LQRDFPSQNADSEKPEQQIKKQFHSAIKSGTCWRDTVLRADCAPKPVDTQGFHMSPGEHLPHPETTGKLAPWSSKNILRITCKATRRPWERSRPVIQRTREERHGKYGAGEEKQAKEHREHTFSDLLVGNEIHNDISIVGAHHLFAGLIDTAKR
jgi:hypothetical protein